MSLEEKFKRVAARHDELRDLLSAGDLPAGDVARGQALARARRADEEGREDAGRSGGVGGAHTKNFLPLCGSGGTPGSERSGAL